MIILGQDAVGASVLQTTAGDLQPVHWTRPYLLEPGCVAVHARLQSERHFTLRETPTEEVILNVEDFREGVFLCFKDWHNIHEASFAQESPTFAKPDHSTQTTLHRLHAYTFRNCNILPL